MLSFPTFTPFFFHWKCGVVPPFVMLAVNVTGEPAQIVVLDALMLTVGVTLGVTVITTPLDVSVPFVWHDAFEVSITVMVSLLLTEGSTRTVVSVPVGTPFTIHWNEGFEPPLVVVAVNLAGEPAQTVVFSALIV